MLSFSACRRALTHVLALTFWLLCSPYVAHAAPLAGVAATVESAFAQLGRTLIAWLPRLMGALLLALIFCVVARLVRAFVGRATRRARLDPNLSQLALAVAFYGVWALGFLTILSALGVDGASIAATVGVSGFVLGFAFKDVLSHFFAGLMLLSGRQFTIGGQIEVGPHEGIVESIDLRALRLRTLDGRLVTIPNGDVFNSAVISNTSNPTRRHEFKVAINLDEDARAAIALAAQTVSGVAGVLSEPPVQVVASVMTANALELRILFYVISADARYSEILSECILRVKAEFERAGIGMPGRAPLPGQTR